MVIVSVKFRGLTPTGSPDRSSIIPNSVLRTLRMPRRNITILFTGLVVCLLCFHRDENDPFARYTAEAFEKIDRYAYVDVPEQELFSGAMQGMVQVLRERGDPFSGFVAPERKSAFDEEFDQQFVGINVRLKAAGDPPRLTVAAPLTLDSPARIAGIRVGDVIVAVDGEAVGPLTDEEYSRTVSRVRGPSGTQVELAVERPDANEPLTFVIKRQPVDIERVLGDTRTSDGTWNFRVPSDPRIALVRIDEFGNKTTDELKKALSQLTGEGVKAIVLDLRHNPGGALDTGVDICEMFLRKGEPIVETRSGKGDRVELTVASHTGKFAKIPLTVLIDGQSASASELVAGCLKDNNRATIVGQQSYGKGTVQQVIPVQAGNSYLKLTTFTFWPPSKRRIHRPLGEFDATDGDWGITPSEGLSVAMTAEQQAAWHTARRQRDSHVSDDPDDLTPDDYIDEVLDVAVRRLSEQLDNSGERPQ